MQVDFHHAVTYVTARCAGFLPDDASVIAYAAQYVDDASNSGVIRFEGGIQYSRISSAHHLVDTRNFRKLANLLVWIPFHFLPGNGGTSAEEDWEGPFVDKLRCTPDSYVAREMIDACCADCKTPYALHRLGITMHVYADTFAHQGFTGICHEINDVSELQGKRVKKKKWQWFKERFLSGFIETVLPLGHGAVLTYPDLPFAQWSFQNEWLERHGCQAEGVRDNPPLFMKAVDNMHKEMVAFRSCTGAVDSPSRILPADRERIEYNLRSFTDNEGRDRHAKWCASIANGDFSFAPEGAERISYVPKGVGSWKHAALETEKSIDSDSDVFPYHDDFLSSNWKLFHDALQKHRFVVLRDILPRYGICGA